MLGILLINYNNWFDTIECVQSIRRSSFTDYRIFILDNASTDDSYYRLYKACKGCRIINSNKNLGFGGGNNKLVEIAMQDGCECFLFLNNDTIIESGMISSLYKYHTSDNIVTPRMMYYDHPELVWYAGGHLSSILGMGFHDYENKIHDSRIKTRDVNFVTGCCFMISRRIIIQLGLFDTSYFMYYEDTDFCFKLKLNRIKITYVDDAVLYHKVSKSTGGTDSPFTIYYGTRNRLYCINKYNLGILAKGYFYFTRGIKYIYMNSNQRKALIQGIKDGRNECMGKRKIDN